MQIPPDAATGAVQVLVSANGLLAAIELKTRGAEPVLVTVTVCAALVVLTACDPKVRLFAESDTIGSEAPVPVSRMTCGLSGALSVRVSDPTLGPPTFGVKVTPIVQFEGGVVAWSGAVVQLLLAIAKLPLATAEDMVNAAVPVFVTVSTRGALVTPTVWFVPKAKLEDDRVTIGEVPAVPVKSTT